MVGLNGHQFEIIRSLPNGNVLEGTVGGQATPALVFSPHEYDPSSGSKDIVVATGLLSSPNQYMNLGEAGLSQNHYVVVFGHDHNHHKWPIRANAQDVIKGTEELGIESLVGIGHSMGTIAMLLTHEDPEFDEKTEKLILVDPPMTGNYSPLDLAKIQAETVVLGLTHPAEATWAGLNAIKEVIKRPRVIGKQIIRLATGKVHSRFDELTRSIDENTDTKVSVVFNHRDGLVPEGWSKSLTSKSVSVYIHSSPDGLAHFAINFGRDLPDGLMRMISSEALPKSLRRVPPAAKSSQTLTRAA